MKKGLLFLATLLTAAMAKIRNIFQSGKKDIWIFTLLPPEEVTRHWLSCRTEQH